MASRRSPHPIRMKMQCGNEPFVAAAFSEGAEKGPDTAYLRGALWARLVWHAFVCRQLRAGPRGRPVRDRAAVGFFQHPLFQRRP